MILTKKKTVGIAIELWTWLAETGKDKGDWPGWNKYGNMEFDCPFCEYVERKGPGEICDPCPYYKAFGSCLAYNMPYRLWRHSVTEEDRKKYAILFLEQLKQL